MTKSPTHSQMASVYVCVYRHTYIHVYTYMHIYIDALQNIYIHMLYTHMHMSVQTEKKGWHT